MSQRSVFHTSIHVIVDHYNRSASIFDVAGVLGVNVNEHVGEHSIHPHIHLDVRVLVMSEFRNAPPLSITVTDLPSQAAMAARANTEVVEAIGRDKQRPS